MAGVVIRQMNFIIFCCACLLLFHLSKQSGICWSILHGITLTNKYTIIHMSAWYYKKNTIFCSMSDFACRVLYHHLLKSRTSCTGHPSGQFSCRAVFPRVYDICVFSNPHIRHLVERCLSKIWVFVPHKYQVFCCVISEQFCGMFCGQEGGWAGWLKLLLACLGMRMEHLKKSHIVRPSKGTPLIIIWRWITTISWTHLFASIAVKSGAFHI